MGLSQTVRNFFSTLLHGNQASQRRAPRFPFATDVRVDAYGKIIMARSFQMGSGGMALEKASALSIAQPLDVTFALPDGRLVTIAAVVRWKRADQVGLRFDPCGDTSAIREWIKQVAMTAASEAPQAAS